MAQFNRMLEFGVSMFMRHYKMLAGCWRNHHVTLQRVADRRDNTIQCRRPAPPQ